MVLRARECKATQFVARAALGVLICASVPSCNSARTKQATSSAARSATPPPTSAVNSLSATPPSHDAAPAPPTASGATGSTPPWPAGTKTITLTWLLHPGSTELGPAQRHVDLVARAGSVQHVISIDARFSISFNPAQQPLCGRIQYPPNTVAELAMNGGGTLWYTVEREQPSALHVYEHTESDGLCTDKKDRPLPCPIATRHIATLDVPAEAKFKERFASVVRVDAGAGHTQEIAIDCDAP
jgi:hypothetical protein